MAKFGRIAIDFGLGSIKLLQIGGKESAPKIDFLDHQEVVLEAGQGADTFPREAVLVALRELFSRNKIKKLKKVAITLPGQTAIVRTLKIPVTEPEKIGQMIRYEAEPLIPFPLDDCAFGYAVLPADPSEAGDDEPAVIMSIMVIAVKSERIDDYVNVLADIGLEPELIEIAPFSSAMAFRSAVPDQKEPVAVIDFGAATTDISVIRNGELEFTRAATVAGRSFTEAIEAKLGVSYDEAERIKCETVKLSAAAPKRTARPGGPSRPGGVPGPAGPKPGVPVPSGIMGAKPGVALPGGAGLMGAKPGALPSVGPKPPGASPPPSAGPKPPAAPPTPPPGPAAPSAPPSGPGSPPPPLAGPKPPGAPPPPPPSVGPKPSAPPPPGPPTGAPAKPLSLSKVPTPPGLMSALPPAPQGPPSPPALLGSKPPAPPSPGGSPGLMTVPGAKVPGPPSPPTSGGLLGAKPPAPPKPPGPGGLMGGQDDDVDESGTNASSIVQPLAERMLAEIRRSLEYYTSQEDGVPVTRIYITGGGAMMSGMKDFLSARLNLEISDLETFGPIAPPSEVAADGAIYQPVVGLGLRLISSAETTLNLLPAALIARTAAADQAKWMKILVVVGSILVLEGAGWCALKYFNRKNQLELLRAEYNGPVKGPGGAPFLFDGNPINHTEVLTKLAELQARKDKLAVRFKTISDLETNRYDWNSIMADVQATIPENSWMMTSSISFVPSGITLSLMSTDQKDPENHFKKVQGSKHLVWPKGMGLNVTRSTFSGREAWTWTVSLVYKNVIPEGDAVPTDEEAYDPEAEAGSESAGEEGVTEDGTEQNQEGEIIVDEEAAPEKPKAEEVAKESAPPAEVSEDEDE